MRQQYLKAKLFVIGAEAHQRQIGNPAVKVEQHNSWQV
jgi:hypothetical protein